MWRFADPRGVPQDGVRLVAALARHEARLDPRRAVVAARAPGRLDVMGGIADYSGSLVLEWPLAAATWVAVQARGDGLVEVASDGAAELAGEAVVTLPVKDLLDEPARVRRLLAADPLRRWTAYALGALPFLARELGASFDCGFTLLATSTVPIGAGVSSSAALEVASALALIELAGLALPARDLALLCQRAENEVAGAPCGVMDPMTAAAGAAGALLALLCQPAEIVESVALPPELELYGIASGIRHEVSGADYGSVRTGAFMGYRILAAAVGLPAEPAGPGKVRIDDPRWRGYLANVAEADLAACSDALPERARGAEFLARYGGITDPVTRVLPSRDYAVRAPALHPIRENARARSFLALLRSDAPLAERGPALGRLMAEAHASYGACGLGCPATDRIVALALAAGPSSGILGAKITGGGSGGTVAVLARRGAEAEVRAVAAAYAAETGLAAEVLCGSSPGATIVGARHLIRALPR